MSHPDKLSIVIKVGHSNKRILNNNRLDMPICNHTNKAHDIYCIYIYIFT